MIVGGKNHFIGKNYKNRKHRKISLPHLSTTFVHVAKTRDVQKLSFVVFVIFVRKRKQILAVETQLGF